jgi:hypothetical protein
MNLSLKEIAVIEKMQTLDVKDFYRITDASWLQTYPSMEKGITTVDIELFLSKNPLETRIKNLENRIKTFEDKERQPYFCIKIKGKVIGVLVLSRVDQNIGEVKIIYLDPKYTGLG